MSKNVINECYIINCIGKRERREVGVIICEDHRDLRILSCGIGIEIFLRIQHQHVVSTSSCDNHVQVALFVSNFFSFNGSTCIVKACTDIKAGTTIFRSGFKFTPMIQFALRKKFLLELNIDCNCRACEDLNNNIVSFAAKFSKIQQLLLGYFGNSPVY